MRFLSRMTNKQTLALYSGHPMGLFPSHPDAPRVVVTNGMVVPNYSSRKDYEDMYATGQFDFSSDALVYLLYNLIAHYSRDRQWPQCILYCTGVSQYGQMTAGSFCYIGPQVVAISITIGINWLFRLPGRHFLDIDYNTVLLMFRASCMVLPWHCWMLGVNTSARMVRQTWNPCDMYKV